MGRSFKRCDHVTGLVLSIGTITRQDSLPRFGAIPISGSFISLVLSYNGTHSWLWRHPPLWFAHHVGTINSLARSKGWRYQPIGLIPICGTTSQLDSFRARGVFGSRSHSPTGRYSNKGLVHTCGSILCVGSFRILVLSEVKATCPAGRFCVRGPDGRTGTVPGRAFCNGTGTKLRGDWR